MYEKKSQPINRQIERPHADPTLTGCTGSRSSLMHTIISVSVPVSARCCQYTSTQLCYYNWIMNIIDDRSATNQPDTHNVTHQLVKFHASDPSSAQRHLLVIVAGWRPIRSLPYVTEPFFYCSSWKGHQVQTTKFAVLYTWNDSHTKQESQDNNARTFINLSIHPRCWKWTLGTLRKQ